MFASKDKFPVSESLDYKYQTRNQEKHRWRKIMPGLVSVVVRADHVPISGFGISPSCRLPSCARLLRPAHLRSRLRHGSARNHRENHLGIVRHSAKGSFRLAANLLWPATVAVCYSKNRKVSNYLQRPSPLQQALQPVTSVNQALL